MRKSKSRAGAGWVATLLSVTIAGIACGTLLTLRHHADGRREGQVMLGHVATAASRQTFEAMTLLSVALATEDGAGQPLDLRMSDVGEEINMLGRRGSAALRELSARGFDGVATRQTAAHFDRLQGEIDAALEMVRRGDYDSAYIYGMRRIRPTFERMEVSLEDATRSFGRRARRGHVIADAGGIATLAIATLLFVLVRRRLQRERRAFEVRLQHEALHDPLTELPNRRLFNDRVETARRRRTRGHGAAVMYIDLDGFKQVNDTKGHEAGDAVLRAVAQRLASCVRAGDTVARIGGDEFALVLTDVALPIEAVGVASRVLQRLHQPFDIGGSKAELGGSVGIAILGDDGESADELCARADTAMYAAKRSGRGAYKIAPPRAATVTAAEPVDQDPGEAEPAPSSTPITRRGGGPSRDPLRRLDQPVIALQ